MTAAPGNYVTDDNSVAFTKRLEMADSERPFARCSRSSPKGAATYWWKRVATPTSMRSATRLVGRSAELNSFQVVSSTSVPSVTRPAATAPSTGGRPGRPSPWVAPCQFPMGSAAVNLACFTPTGSVNSASITGASRRARTPPRTPAGPL